MELLETQDPERAKLLQSSEMYKREMEREMKNISEKTEKALKNALVIGGALALTYVLVSSLSSSKSKKKKTRIVVQSAKPEKVEESVVAQATQAAENNLLTQLGTKLVNTATLMLLDMAKDKLTEFLKPKSQENENP